MSWSELAKPLISDWALYFPDIVPFDPQALRFVHNYSQDIEGTYRGRQLKLNVIADHMVITLSSQHRCPKPLTKDDPKFKHIVQFLTSGIGISLKGEIQIKSNGQIVTYKQTDVENNAGYVKCLFDLMSDLIDAYPTLMAMGGELLPVLLTDAIKQNGGLRSLNAELLKDIAQVTIKGYRHQASRLLCPTCLVRCSALQIDLPWIRDRKIIYYGCRSCGQCKEFLKTSNQITVVLDNKMALPYSLNRQTFWINWLSHRRLCDFDRVEIVQATDEDVERFVVQLGNDTDIAHKEQNKHISCILSARCELSDNTMRILEWWFEKVEVKEMTSNGKYPVY